MKLRWTGKALSDLGRLYDFLAPANRQAAARTARSLRAAPRRLLQHPRLGERIPVYEPRKVRRLIVGEYELRYEIVGDSVVVLRLWHGREDR